MGIKYSKIGIIISLIFVTTTLSAGGNFRLPKIDGVFINWCLTWSKQCGKPAADKFCQIKGFHNATIFKKINNIGTTKILATGKTCHNPDCNAFLYIKCVQKPQEKSFSNKNPYQHPKQTGTQQQRQQQPKQTGTQQQRQQQPKQTGAQQQRQQQPKQTGAQPLEQTNRQQRTTPANLPLKQRILNPRISGVRVDWCLNDNKKCGLPVADRYCQKHGFKYSISHRLKANVRQTANIITGKACGGKGCKSFSYIDCHR